MTTNSRDRRTRLIVNADDFGRSTSINQAILRAHCEGILTSASLMVAGPAADEAVELARQHPRLAVGLHLTLADGMPALRPEAIPGLVSPDGRLDASPLKAGWRYFWMSGLRESLRREIDAQVGAFHQTGLAMDHLNGHLHLHLHPVVFSLLMEGARDWKLTHMRLTRDPFGQNLRLASGRWGYRLTHALMFGWLARRAQPALEQAGIRHTQAVYGLLQDGRVDEAFLLRLLDTLPGGDFELYSHPSLGEFRHELDALLSERVKSRLQELGIPLIRYQDI